MPGDFLTFLSAVCIVTSESQNSQSFSGNTWNTSHPVKVAFLLHVYEIFFNLISPRAPEEYENADRILNSLPPKNHKKLKFKSKSKYSMK